MVITFVPNSNSANGRIGTGTGATFLPESTQVPNPQKADGSRGVGSNPVFLSGSTPIPYSNKADGLDGSWSAVPFQGGLPRDGTPIPHPGAADDR